RHIHRSGFCGGVPSGNSGCVRYLATMANTNRMPVIVRAILTGRLAVQTTPSSGEIHSAALMRKLIAAPNAFRRTPHVFQSERQFQTTRCDSSSFLAMVFIGFMGFPVVPSAMQSFVPVGH